MDQKYLKLEKMLQYYPSEELGIQRQSMKN